MQDRFTAAAYNQLTSISILESIPFTFSLKPISCTQVDDANDNQAGTYPILILA